MLRHDDVLVNVKPEPARVPHPKNRALCDFRVGCSTLTRRFVGGGKQAAAMVAAESDEMTLSAVLKTRESPWREDNLALFRRTKSVTYEHPHSSQKRA